MRVPYRDPESAPAEIREVIEDTPLALLRVIAHAETAFRPWLRYSNALLRDLELDPLLRELAILQVAGAEGSDYERTQHVPIAESFGAAPETIAAIEGPDEGLGALPADQRAVLRFTRAVLRRGSAGEEELGPVRALLGDRGVVELLLVIGNYLGLARLIATVGLEPHEPVVRLPGGTDALGPR